MEYKVGDIVYIVEAFDAKLSHQADGIELYKCKVVEPQLKDKDLYAKKIKNLYQVGKNPHASHTILDDPLSGVMNIREWSRERTFHKNLSDAQKEMISKIFLKKKWL